MNSPALSILMPAYNSERFIGESISSILNQRFTDLELIIINDGSTDNTAQVISTFRDSRIRFTDRHVNKGVVYTRNEALAMARADFIAFFDADDVAHPDKFYRQMGYLRNHPSTGMIATSARLIDTEGRRIGQWVSCSGTQRIRARMLFRNSFVNSSVLFRRETVEGLSYDEGSDSCEDYIMWWRMAERTDCRILRAQLTDYRIHPDSLTGSRPALLAGCDRAASRLILEGYGITPTEQELSIHLALKRGDLIVERSQLNGYRNWLLRFLQPGRQNNGPSPALRWMLINRWFKACYLCRTRPLLLLQAASDLGFYLRILNA